MPHTYQHPRAALTVDCVVFGIDQGELKVLLIRRGLEPFRGQWALPGGFVRIDEDLDEAARRELEEETGLKRVFLEQLYTFSAVSRDPRERVVSTAYYALVKMALEETRAATDASDAKWFAVTSVPRLAFDHREILDAAHARLRGKLRYQPIGFELLPSKFTLPQLQQLYETVLGEPLDKRNFRKKILGLGLLASLNEKQKDGPRRPATLFKFDIAKYRRLAKQGFNFEL